MGIKERQERQREEMRSLILQGAGEIIAQEGLDSLSIRKIAQRIEYSPAIIYHYFSNKDHILQSLIMDRYQQLMSGFKNAQIKSTDPLVILKEFLLNYAKWAIEQKAIYTSLMFNTSPSILEYTGVLRKGILGENRPAINLLAQVVRSLANAPELSDEVVELRVQVLWSAAFGMIIRIIIEDIPLEQQDRLIEEHFKILTKGLQS